MKITTRRALVPLALTAALAAIGTGLATGDTAKTTPNYSPPPISAERTTLLERNGIDPAKQFRGATTPSGKTYYRSSNGEKVCVTDEHASGGCYAKDAIPQGKSFGGELCGRDLPPHLTRIRGAVPDGAVSVTISTGAGTRYEQAPVAGTVAFEIPRTEAGATDHVDITWTLEDGGSQTVELPMPPFVKGTVCA